MGLTVHLSGADIRSLRQRLGWSLAEMARRMGCNTQLIQAWEASEAVPDPEAQNQLAYLMNHLDTLAEELSQKPLLEKQMEEEGRSQVTHRDFLKDH